MLLLATLAFLPAYAFSAAADIVLMKNHSSDFNLFSFPEEFLICFACFWIFDICNLWYRSEGCDVWIYTYAGRYSRLSVHDAPEIIRKIK